MRDDFSEDVKRTVAERVSRRCSRCNAQTSGPQVEATKSLNIGVAAHITAAAIGGPRYNPILTPEERKHPDNAIWLCQTCAKLVDNDPIQFPEILLRSWKAEAEAKALNSIGRPYPSAQEQTEQSEPPYLVDDPEGLPWLSMHEQQISNDPQIEILKRKGWHIGGGAVGSLGQYLGGGSQYVVWKQPGTNRRYRLFAGFGREPGPLDLIWLMQKLHDAGDK